eukprot:s1192_g5.t1
MAWIIAHASILEGHSLSTYDAIKWRTLYWQQVFAERPQITFHLGGQGDVEIAVQAILKEHGVPVDKLQDRTAMILRQPWQALKSLANAHKPMLRLITHEELQAVIASKTKSGQAVGSKQNKKPATTAPIQVAPDEIHLPAGLFSLSTGEPLAQLSARQFGSTAKGMVLITEQDFKPFQSQGLLSDSGLRFLVLSPFTQETASQGQVLRFPVQSVATGEPILLSAVLIQKGKVEVLRTTPTKPQCIEQVETQTVKFLFFRDQSPVAWDSVCQQPVRHLLDLIGGMKVCKQEGCNCSDWHPAHHSSEQPVLDVWQRDFVSLHFQKSRPADAAMFVVHMRLAKEAFLHCYRQSGSNGIFLEPRSQDGRSQDDQFQTVWLQKQNLSEAKALQAVISAQSSLIRVNQRYGLKVRLEDAPQVHAKVKPHEPYMSGACHTYRVGPMPWGTTKRAMQALLSQWSWNAKVLHSAGKSVDATGLMWSVSSPNAPPCTAYQLAHGDVVIHQESRESHQTWHPPRVQVSPSLMKLKNQVDPLQNAGDPWAATAKTLPSVQVTDTVNAKLASIEATIDQKIQDKLQQAMPDDVPMANDPEPRLAAMEQQIAQLQAHSGSLDKKVDQIQRQVELQSTTFTNALDSKLADHMAKIEALMNKRSRTE